MEPKSIILAIVLFILLSLEVLFPYFEQKNKIKHLFNNGIFILGNTIVINLLLVPLILVTTKLNIGLFTILKINFWLELIITILLIDALTYFLHIMYHKIPFFWRFHKVHHSDTHMDVSTGARFHIGEHLSSTLFRCVLYLAFGMRFEFIVLYETIFIASVLFQHANITISEPIDRIYRWFFTSPNMHKIHHSHKMDDTNSNYTSLFSFWDRLFKTYRETDVKKIRFGVNGLEKEQNPLQMLKTPWKRK